MPQISCIELLRQELSQAQREYEGLKEVVRLAAVRYHNDEGVTHQFSTAPMGGCLLCQALAAVKAEARARRLETWISCVATDSQLDTPVPALGGQTGRNLFVSEGRSDD